MKNISKISTLFILSTLIVSTLNIPPALSSECTTGDSNGHCVKVSKDKQVPSSNRKGNKSENNTQDLVKANSTPSGSAISPEEAVQKWNEEHPIQLDGANQTYRASSVKARQAGDAECHTEPDHRPSHYVIGSLPLAEYPTRSAGATAYPMTLKPSPPTILNSPRALLLRKCSKKLRTNSLTPTSRPPY